MERQPERSREGQRGPQVKTTSADRGNHQILSTTLWASIPQLARTGSFAPHQSTGSGCHLVSGYFRQPPNGVPDSKALPQKEQSCQSAGLSPWTGKKEYFQTPFGVWLPHDFQGKTYIETNMFSGGNRRLSVGTRDGHHDPEGTILEWFSQGWGAGGRQCLHFQPSISPLVEWGVMEEST